MITKFVVPTLIAVILSATPALANLAISNISCSATDVGLVYNCQFDLFEDGDPIADAEITVGASMPSMPMAHNVKPVTAQAVLSEELDGIYRFV